jgi:hypothetical protein
LEGYESGGDMSTLVAEWIGIAVSPLAAVLFLKFYYTSKMSRFYQKKWVIVACSFIVLYAIIEVINAGRNYTEGRVPTKGEIQQAIAANNTLVDQDLIFKSPDGYTLVVPAGCAYTTFSSGAMSMTAVKKQSNSAIIVARYQTSEGLERLVEETIEVLKRKNLTYAFPSESPVSIGDKEAIKVDVDVEKEGIPIKGILIFAHAGNSTFEVMMSCPASVFSQESMEFEKVIQSLGFQ